MGCPDIEGLLCKLSATFRIPLGTHEDSSSHRSVHRFLSIGAGPAITHFQQVESKGAIFWEPLVFAIGLAEAYRVSLGWAPPTSENFNKLRADYEPGADASAAHGSVPVSRGYICTSLQAHLVAMVDPPVTCQCVSLLASKIESAI